ncbi:hypothetical protein C1E24_00010 [Pseudoalteromonas phenolica]|uniref:Uncharacterized protein n=1 Tax=Pseudoalteromonas phenolica TaxID=161398 RepID=A0A5R9Q710_9GAMM|nr:hypothetical protein [Pseudoalteromonas phenolica]TLX48930.1 hypothetical protein C1E24_00010 [Pseudoalteromonas phenolica]
MRIGNAMPIHLNAPTNAKDKDVQTEQVEKTEEAADSQDESIHISMEGRKKLQEEPEDPKDKLPPHIKQMIEAIERLIEMIEAAEEALAKAKEVDYPDDESKRDALDMHQNQINSLEFARHDAIKGLQEAMKEAGISEPGIIAELMR